MLNPIIVMTSCLFAIFVALVYPILKSMSPYPEDSKGLTKEVKECIMVAFFISLIPLCIFLSKGSQAVTYNWNWSNALSFDINTSLIFDYYSVIFLPVALFVSWSIMEFAVWYMHADPLIYRFFKYMLAFLIAMLVLVTANNIFQLFIGWEGVGMMSFLLIAWWWGRADANTAAVQAVLYNRVGDAGLILAMSYFVKDMNTWELQQIFSNMEKTSLTLPLLGLVLAATGKSAQFGLHPWLPAAMEGPTPVSALLHSSTMVVAGIFLLIRLNPLMQNYPGILSVCLWVGALTTLYAATCALTQSDIKKIIAFSTSSQLGLMMVTIGLNQPQLAFLHICTHAFFKAMLFLCSGSIIHSLNDEQDIRKMGGAFRLVPFTSTCFTIGSLALIGMPFLAGFFSKDIIIETFNTSYVNSFALIMTLLATSFTAVYSLRLIYYVTMGHPRFPPLSPISENNPNVIFPLLRLAIGSIVAGLVITSNIHFPKTPIMTMPLYLKVVALVVTFIGLIVALEIAKWANKQASSTPKLRTHILFTLGLYYAIITHRLPPKTGLGWGQSIASQTVDQTWLEKSGPKSIYTVTRPTSSITSNAQKGMVKTFLTLFLITFALGLAVLFSA
uniref:NADH-ubiquinone oxidoreductase chain 5 n=1 Tax=Priolepis cincta TaxID=166757 RepID=A0A455TPT3_9GOBI|nr:NADH dehydrogenase subunit 5 [Priolepis cincta]